MRRQAVIVAIFIAAGFGERAVAATFLVVTTDDTGAGSLREAIAAANDAPGADTIAFATPGAGPHTIAPATALPNITGPTMIDGFTQAGPEVYAIVLAGHASPVGTSGLRLQGGGGSTISGLVINRFFDAIRIVDSDDNGVFDCYLGLDASGMSVPDGPNQRSGVRIETGSRRNVIGAPGRGNVMAANVNGVGIVASSTENTVQSNLFGTNKDGSAAVGRGFGSVLLGPTTFGNLIGGAGPGEGNLCSNGTNGISINGDHNTIVGNFVGTDRTGTYAISNDYGILFNTNFPSVNRAVTGNVVDGNLVSGNVLAGVAIVNGSSGNTVRRNQIGSDVSGTKPLGNANGVALAIRPNDNLIEENLIAYNTGDGVVVVPDDFDFLPDGPPTGNRIRANSIHSNGLMGIELTSLLGAPPPPEGPTLNDLLDEDVGPNRLQNFPVLSAEHVPGEPGMARISGTLGSAANTEYEIEIFASRDARMFIIVTEFDEIPFRSAEGEIFLGRLTVLTDGGGNATFALPPMEVPHHHFLTATATNLSTNDTSEFSEAILVGQRGQITAIHSYGDPCARWAHAGRRGDRRRCA